MTNDPNKTEWKAIGQSITSPSEDKKRKEVQLQDIYYIVIGFEVNKPAFADETLDLSVDYGHAFFYLGRNNTIQLSFSFGPDGIGKIGWFDKGGHRESNVYNIGALIKDGAADARPGTADYGMDEAISAFKIPISAKQANDLTINTNDMRKKIRDRKQKFTAWVNDTCAETARDILNESGIETPSGSGWVKRSKTIDFPIAYAVNPYKWHYNFLQSGAKMIRFEPNVRAGRKWRPPIKDIDPIFSEQN
jgi:hypothetical protein